MSNSTGMAAIIWNAGNQNVANDEARAKCGGGDCQVVLQFAQCGALSTASNAFIYGVAKGGQSCAAPAALPAACN